MILIQAILPSVLTFGLSVMGGAGSWFGDDTKSSISYGGGVAFKPGVEFMEVVLTYDRSPIKLKMADRYGPALKGDSLNHFRAGVTFPSEITAFNRVGYFFPMISYVLVTNSSKLSHGLGIGGGLGLPIYERIGIRFEVVDQFYRIPIQSGGETSLQQDFFLNIRILLNIF